MKFFFNTLFLLLLAIVFILGLLAVGSWLRARVLREKTESVFGVIVALGLGL
ncbi:MAG: hypothetical protein H6765_09635 [Candidatus Peribacteria bacterium]|nr:MAG: hypothetical protein H6765_09635 [Candidatus Peribacteria bacterium]